MFERLLKAIGVPDEPGPARQVPSGPAPERTTRSLAREALVAAIDPDSGKPSTNADYTVAGALLVELAGEGRVVVSGEGRRTRVSVADASPLGDPELDKALSRLAIDSGEQKVSRTVWLLPGAEQVVERLVGQGVLLEGSRTRLGVFTSRVLEATPAAGRDEIVARLRSALLGESVPDRRTAQLVSVVTIGVHLKLFVPRDRVDEAYRRADEILAGLGEADRALMLGVRAARDRTDSGGGDSSGL